MRRDSAGAFPAPTFDWAKLVAAKEKEISRLSAIYRVNLEKAGVAIFESRAEILDPHTVRLKADGRQFRARKILVATGGTPALEPPAPGREYAITSNEVFDLPDDAADAAHHRRRLYRGRIRLDFRAARNQVAIATRGENVLRGFDEDMRCGVRDALIHAGVDIHFNQLLTGSKRPPTACVAHSTEGLRLDVDQVMIATGRRRNTAGLGLEKRGVELDRVGAIKVDAFSQSSIPSIYAVGDVTNRLALTPIAIREGHAFADTVFGGKPTAVVHANVPTAVFTTPEVGTVGLSEARRARI